MRLLVRLAALPAACLLQTVAVGQAATPPATLTCTDGHGEKTTLPVAAFTFDSPANGSGSLTVYTDLSLFNRLLRAEYFGSGFLGCDFGGDSGTNLQQVTIQDVTASSFVVGSQPGTTPPYASVTLAYENLSLRSAKAGPSMANAPAEKTSALAALQVRVPPVGRHQ